MMTTEEAIERFAEYSLSVKNLRPATVKTYLAGLRDFQRRMHEYDLFNSPRPVLIQYLDRLSLAKKAPSTRNSRRNALRAFFLAMEDLGLRDDNPALRLTPIEESIEPPPHFTVEELNRVIFGTELPVPPIRRGRREPAPFWAHRVATAVLVEPRDTAILGLVLGVGLRVSEPASLNRGDYDEETGEVLLRGAKQSSEPQRLQVRIPAVLSAMSNYLTELWRSPWANHPALFPPFFTHERSQGGFGLSAASISAILKKRIKRAGIEPRGRRLSPHTFARYSLATMLHKGGKNSGMSEFEIARILRHKSMDTTRRYINSGTSGRLAARAASILGDLGLGRGVSSLPDSRKP